MENDAFSVMRGRYLLILWLLPFFYMPGIEFFTYHLLDSTDEWYWYTLLYIYYYHIIIALGALITLYLSKPDWQVMLGKFHQKELIPALKLTAFIFIFSIAAAFILFYPLSFIIPDFVQYWFIDTSPLIYVNDDSSYPLISNFLSFMSLVVLAPIIEEFVFRGLLLHRWNKKYGLTYAILLSSFIFGIVHPDPIGAIAFGIAMCILYLRTQSLWVPIICHSINNFVVWIIYAGYIASYGPEYTYTLEDFQNEWPINIVSIFIVIIWLHYYINSPKAHRKWRLPDA